jgi:hypothetical protein
MKAILSHLFDRASNLIDVQPILALFLGGGLLAVFLTAFLRPHPPGPEARQTLLWTLYRHVARLVVALSLVAFLVGTMTLLRTYLHRTLSTFERSHGRITEANYNAIQTIWGTPHEQRELKFDLYHEQEVTERIESEDLTKPAVLRKKIVRTYATGNPFLTSTHQVTLRQNPRKKGSALYGGYETECRFAWKLRNPADRDLSSLLVFPLPSATGIYNDLTATLNGEDVLAQMQLKEGALSLARNVKANEDLDFCVGFKSRGMSSWYFQVQEPREIRDFTLTLNLPDLPKPRLNFPEGCMTPTATQPTADGKGTILTFRLDHAISAKGMGVAMPTVAQPGAATTAVLQEIERGWLLVFAMLVLGLTVSGAAHPVVLCVVFGAVTACTYGLLGDFSDTLLGFWGTAGLILIPSFCLLAWLLARSTPTSASRLLPIQLLAFGLLYPCLAGLDSDRQPLYFDIAALSFLAIAAWQLTQRFWKVGGAPGALVTEPSSAAG